jgi:hypothetical protein
MLNIFKKKQKNYNDKSLNNNNTNSINIHENFKILNKVDKNEYKNLIFYPSSTKEWFNSVYSYNKSYIKSLIAIDVTVNNLFTSYFNMLQDRIKILFKRRRHNKSRYSANKIYVSRTETKHTNTKLVILLYVFNKQKASVERHVREHINLTITKKYLVENEIVEKLINKNRLTHILKKQYFIFKKFNIAFIKKTDNLLKGIVSSVKLQLNLYKIPVYYIILLKKLSRLQLLIFNATDLINFNISKFHTLVLNWKDLGLKGMLEKIYDKEVLIKIIDLKSIHLNSDVFASAVVLKLRDRQNKVVTVLRKAVLQMVKIPDLHTLITFDDRMENINEENILNVIKQQVVSGVRFEAAGRLTRRLTAMRAIFKLRYVGSLKNIRSSLNNLASTILRGFVKSNAQYILIMSKTRNGSFGLKSWVSSH